MVAVFFGRPSIDLWLVTPALRSVAAECRLLSSLVLSESRRFETTLTSRGISLCLTFKQINSKKNVVAKF